MSLYVDSSAYLKLYLDEAESDVCEAILSSDADWICARHGLVEIRRSLSRLLSGRDLATARSQFKRDWASTSIIDLTDEVCGRATEIAEATACRSLDALHLGAAAVAGSGSIPLITYDHRQADSARSLGWTVLGA